ncbi:MAG: cation:proton antiporter [Betaproteobacteria bacterium]|nr:cation:proton antiporter [Betaproteobacteria bacterium]MDE2123351.1 cation:proton antiporter [Betaproteobacteria bacterium]MDE2187770.1 cation:proton antiporter [Betaproteobacteria bacterium]MDE2323775.1 cation:proton antiporter [Betaproteobacteria bacterium]
MPEFHALPLLSLHADGVLWVGLALVLATLMGESVFRFLRWPRLIGYTAAGLVIAAGGGGLQALALQPSARAIVDAALAVLLFEIGHRVNLRWLRANPWLIFISLGEWALSLVAMWVVLGLLGLGGLHGLATAAALACTAPAVALRLSGEFNARGQVTERLLLVSALGTILSILAVGVLTAWMGAQASVQWWNALLLQVYGIGGAVLAAAVLAWAVNWVERHFDFADEGAALLLVGLILLVLSITRMLHWSTLLTPLLAGLLLRARSQRPRVWPRHFGTAGGVLVVLLFLILGLSLNWAALASGMAMGLALAGVRALAKLAVPLALGKPSGLSWRQSTALGLTLNPAAGVSFVLLLDLAQAVPQFPHMLIAAAFAAIVVLELAGTLLARWALGRSGDIAAVRKKPQGSA